MGAKIIHGQTTGWEIQKNYGFPQITKKIGFHWIYSCPDPAVRAIHKWQCKAEYWSREVCQDNKLCSKVTTKADSKELKKILTNAEQPDSKTSHTMYPYQIQTQALERKIQNRKLLAVTTCERDLGVIWIGNTMPCGKERQAEHYNHFLMKRIENKPGKHYSAVVPTLNLKYMHFWLLISKTSLVSTR